MTNRVAADYNTYTCRLPSGRGKIAAALSKFSALRERGRHHRFMSRPRFDQPACDQLAQAVREIESQTDAEIVIVVRARSTSYRHADYLCGAILSFLCLLFLLFSPFEFQHYWVAIDVVIFFALGAFISSRTSDTVSRTCTMCPVR